MAQLEKKGLPTVTWTAERFVKDARVSAGAFGLTAISLAHLPEPATNQTEDVITQMVDASIGQVIQGLTKNEKPASSDVKSRPSEILEFEGDDLLDAAETMTKSFLKEAWSDGFPLIPPTPAAVERMLSGTILPREEVVCLLEPGFGIASVEKIAINAVMAGCRPEHLPVVITAVQCLADPMMATRHGSMSTGPQSPLLVVNGPIAKKVNINAKSCALGPGSISYANTVIGRAIRLIMMNIGQCYPGVADMDTLGSPTKYSMCLAENQDDNPWDPYSVEKGYDKDASTVTVHFNYGLCDVHDPFSTTPEGLIETFSSLAAQPVRPAFGRWLSTGRGAAKSPASTTFHDMIILCPDHAKIFGKHNWNKKMIQEAIHARARVPLQAFLNHGYKAALEKFHPEFLSTKDNPGATVPALAGPESYDIVIAGTDVGRSCFTWGFYQPVTKPVKS